MLACHASACKGAQEFFRHFIRCGCERSRFGIINLEKATTEPLAPDLWFDQVARLDETLEAMDGAAPDKALRRLSYLVELAPGPLKYLFERRIDQHMLEAFLECAAYDAAALWMVGPPISLDIRRPSHARKYTVTVVLPDDAGKGHKVNESLAKAILGAWCESFLTLLERSSINRLTQHRSRSGSQRRSTKH